MAILDPTFTTVRMAADTHEDVLPPAPTPDLDAATIRAFLDGCVPADDLPEPHWGPIGREVYERTYARDIPGLGLEVWADTVRRVVNGSLGLIDRAHWRNTEDVDLFRLIYEFRAIPAGRHLWVTGTAARHMSRNCWAAGFSHRTSSHFRFLAARLFEGGGVGANYSADVLAMTQPIAGSVHLEIACQMTHPDEERVYAVAGDKMVPNDPASPRMIHLGKFSPDRRWTSTTVVRVADTREGWVNAWVDLIDMACTPGTHRLVIDVSTLRPQGSPLKTFGGTASGPEAFVRSLLEVSEILASALDETPRRLTGLEAMAIDHAIASSVVAGGARRSARISLMSWLDPEVFDFISCKTDHMHHWTTNISVEIDDEFHAAIADPDHPRHGRAKSVLHAVAVGMTVNGEPGMIDTAKHSADEPEPVRIVNPCAEASLQSHPVGLTGNDVAGESCNLGSVDLASFGTDHEGATYAFELMARFLYRATLTQHHDPTAMSIENGNRRIGVGIMGLQGWVASHGYRLSELPAAPDLIEKLTDFRFSVRIAANQLADELGLPHPVKVTAVAPTGTIAQLGGTTPGIHPVFARYFIRRVRFTTRNAGLEAHRAAGYKVIPDIYAADTSVVEFVVRDAILDRYPADLVEQTDEIPVDRFLDIIATVQNAFCGEGDGQAVSATAQIPPDAEPTALANAIKLRLGTMKGFTVFPSTSRPLSPYEAISEDEYLAMEAAGLSTATGDSNSGECAGGACPIR